MDIEDRQSNEFFELEESRSAVVITYRRRKRGSSASDVVKVSGASCGRTRDIGWDHGEIVDGNRFGWICKWCGLIRYSGGVSRLKNHLAGAFYVKKCPNVPEDVAKSIMQHLIETKKQRTEKKLLKYSGIHGRESSSSRNDDDVVIDCTKSDMEIQVVDSGRSNKKATRRSKNNKIGTQTSKSATQHPRAISQLPEIGMTKANIDTSHPEMHNRIISSWKNVIEHQLKPSYVKPGRGIWNVLHDALSLGHSQLPQKLMLNDVMMDNEVIKGIHLGNSEDRKFNSSETAEDQTVEKSKVRKKEKNANTRNCERAFLEILISEKFGLFCDFLLGTFDENKTNFFLDFSMIDSKLKDGHYEHSPERLNKDVQLIWDKVQRIGEEMIILASSLSSLSRTSCNKQVLEGLLNVADEPKPEVACQIGAVKNSFGSNATTQFTYCGSDCSTNPDQMQASDLYKASSCRQCGTEANGERSLICDGCEAMYHFSCIEPAIQEIPTRSWYCAACRTNNKDSADPAYTENKNSSLHHNCVVCNRLEVSETVEETVEDLDENGSRIRVATDSSSVSSLESEGPAELSRAVALSLCKICGTCEDEDKKFLVCGHIHCPYKFYHIRCLKNSQMASAQQLSRPFWYCPSCLCRACLTDKDDDKIVLCDGCDEAYHTYCMKPPRITVPKGQWFCVSCNVGRAREAMRRYEQWILQQHRKNDCRQSKAAIGSVNLLLSAAEELGSGEKMSVDH